MHIDFCGKIIDFDLNLFPMNLNENDKLTWLIANLNCWKNKTIVPIGWVNEINSDFE